MPGLIARKNLEEVEAAFDIDKLQAGGKEAKESLPKLLKLLADKKDEIDGETKETLSESFETFAMMSPDAAATIMEHARGLTDVITQHLLMPDSAGLWPQTVAKHLAEALSNASMMACTLRSDVSLAHALVPHTFSTPGAF